MIDNEVFNFSDIAIKRDFQSTIGRLDGYWRITLREARPRVTDPQRGYYFGVVVRFFADYMREQDPTLTLKEAADTAHLEIKHHCLPEPIIDADGRLIAERVGSVTKIDKQRMSKLIDDAILWLASEWRIAVPPPTRDERDGSAESEAA